MATDHRHLPAAVGQAYAALRHGGASQARAMTELAVEEEQAVWLEGVFRRSPAGHGMDAMRPRFARHEAHVAAVMAEGGFPALSR